MALERSKRPQSAEAPLLTVRWKRAGERRWRLRAATWCDRTTRPRMASRANHIANVSDARADGRPRDWVAELGVWGIIAAPKAPKGHFGSSEPRRRTPCTGPPVRRARAVLGLPWWLAESWCAFYGNMGLLSTPNGSVIRQLSFLDRVRLAPLGWASHAHPKAKSAPARPTVAEFGRGAVRPVPTG